MAEPQKLSVVAGNVGVKVSPVLTGFNKDLRDGLTKEAKGAGTEAGRDFGDSFTAQALPDIKKLGAELGKARNIEEQAASRARVAEASLAAAREKVNAATNNVQRAEEGLTRVRQAGGSASQVERAERALDSARARLAASNASLVRQEENLSNAKRKAEQASRDAHDADVAFTLGKEMLARASRDAAGGVDLHTTATERNRREVDRSRDSHHRATRSLGVLKREIGDAVATTIAGGMAFAAMGSVLSGLIPIIAASIAALTGLGLAVAGAAAGLGIILMLAQPLVNAFQAQTQAENEAARNSQANAQKRADATRQVQEAENGLARAKRDAARENEQANQAIKDSEKNLSDTIKQAKRDERDAVQGVADARVMATDKVNSAIERQRDAEEKLKESQQSAVDAQRDLIRARQDAADQLADLTARTVDGQLAEERAEISLQRARENLAKMNEGRETTTEVKPADQAKILAAKAAVERAQDRLNKTNANKKSTQLQKQAAADALAAAKIRQRQASEVKVTTKTTGKEHTDLDRREAALGVKEAEQNLAERRRANAQLARDKAKADRDGVDGSDRVQSALRRVADANRDIRKAQDEVAKSAAAVRKAQIDGARDVAEAQQKLADTQVKNQDAITAAQRRLADERKRADEVAIDGATKIAEAQNRLANQMDKLNNPEKITASAQKYQQALDALSPAGLRFLGVLRGMQEGWQELGKEAQEGALPGVMRGINAAGAAMPATTLLVRNLSRAVGQLAEEFGNALGSAEGQAFIRGLAEVLPRAMIQMGQILGNLGRAFLIFFTALTPLGMDFNDTLVGLTENFANWMAEWVKSDSFKEFVSYMRDNLPRVGNFLFELGRALVNVAESLSGVGADVLDGGAKLFRWISDVSDSNPGMLLAAATLGGLAAGLIRLSPIVSLLTGSAKGLFKVLKPLAALLGIGIKGGDDDGRKKGRGLSGALSSLGSAASKAKGPVDKLLTPLTSLSSLLFTTGDEKGGGKLGRTMNKLSGVVLPFTGQVNKLNTALKGLGAYLGLSSMGSALGIGGAGAGAAAGGAGAGAGAGGAVAGGAAIGVGGPIVAAALAAVAALGLLYWKSEEFRGSTKEGVQSVKDEWTRARPQLQQIWSSIRQLFDGFCTGLSMAWNRYGNEAKGSVSGLWTAIRGIFRGQLLIIQGNLNMLLGLMTGDWSRFGTGFKQLTTGIWEAIKGVFQGGISFVWNIFTGFVKMVLDSFTNLVVGIIRGVKKFGREFNEHWDDWLRAAGRILVKGLETLVGFFTDFDGTTRKVMKGLTDWLGPHWDSIREIFAKPINAVIRFINDPFISNLNKIGKELGFKELPKLTEVNWSAGSYKPPARTNSAPYALGVPNNLFRRAEGGPIPGPWKGPKADNVLGVDANGIPTAWVNPREYVVKVSSVERLERENPGLLDHINRTGTLPRYHTGGEVWDSERPGAEMGGPRTSPIRGAAPPDAGVWKQMKAWVQKNIPWARITSTYRKTLTATGNVSNHARGLAIDIAGGDMKKIFKIIKSKFPNSLELIHSPMGNEQVRHGRPHYYTGSTRANHFDHVHWAIRSLTGGGGDVDGNIFSSAWNWASNKASDVLGGLTGAAAKGVVKLLDPLAEAAKKGLSFLPDSPFPAGMAKATGKTVVDASMNFLEKKINEWAPQQEGYLSDEAYGGEFTGNYTPSAGVNQWRSVATEALQRVGAPTTLLNSLLRRMQKESGGNPRAINLTDSNARRGTPSQGLMQVIPPTFQAYRDKSLPNNILDPLANIVASLRYAKAAYGDIGKAYNKSGGYADGGMVDRLLPKPELWDIQVGQVGQLAPGPNLMINKLGKTEYLQRVDPTKPGLGVGGAPLVNISEMHNHGSGREVVDELAFAVRTRRFGGVYN